jgi:hypothetical protein
MTRMVYSFTAELWEWTSRTSWFFVDVPEDQADDIEERFGRRAAGFGSVRVEVTIGSTTWQTSIFPSKEKATYVLPLKKAVRVAEGLEPGSPATVDLRVLID